MRNRLARGEYRRQVTALSYDRSGSTTWAWAQVSISGPAGQLRAGQLSRLYR